jgi:glycosyltransferase involved in cell wall biosynthesis
MYGPVDNITPVYNSIDLLVSTARLEPFGRTIIEAMAAEKPVIAVKAGGPEEIIIEGKTGFLVSKGDIETLADSIVKLLSDDKMAQRLGQAGKDIVKDRFTSEIYVKNVQKIINSV